MKGHDVPRYYLNIRFLDDLVVDPEGAVYPNLAAARSEAIESARELMADRVRRGKRPDGDQFEIVDAAGMTVLTVPFQEAFD